MVLKLLLQPIVENALNHGINYIRNQGVILIKVYAENKILKIRIQDNGVGMNEATISKIINNKINSKSIGLSNVISRIKLNFGDTYGLYISSEPYVCTIVEISIPLISLEEVKGYV